ncbi:amidohydrolase [Vibrio variabilis]|uniref:amidohydrolase n=1 Tax=Vibrio variabilis TaxID=990271 RepID=UPI000DD726BA|nr:amidohydrolase [Vibrio variabilis]
MNAPSNSDLSSSHCHHEGEIHCSCCSPLWKYLLPTIELEEGELSYVSYEGKVNKASPTALIFRTEQSIPIEQRQYSELGYIQTLEAGQDKTVEAVGVVDGKIVATGSYELVSKAIAGEAEERIVHSGQTLLPGLVEPHLHIIPTAAFNLLLDVGPFDGQELLTNVSPNNPYTVEYILNRLKSAAEENRGDSQWIMGRDVDPSLLVSEDKEFNATVLDAVSQTQPIFLMNASMHLAYVNSVGVKELKQHITSFDVSDDGILKESGQIIPVLQYITNQLFPDRRAKEMFRRRLDESVRKIFTQANERGVTYILDAGVAPKANDSDADTPSVSSSLPATPFGIADPITNQPAYLSWCASRDDCGVRISGSLAATSLKEFSQKIAGHYQPNAGNEEFNIAFIKLVADGSNQGLTGYQYTPYACDENYNRYDQLVDSSMSDLTSDDADPLAKQTNEGIFNYGYPLEFNALMNQAVNNGWPVMVHSNGDHSSTRTINAFRLAGLSKETSHLRRDRIEHASLLSDEHLAQMEELGISPSFLIGHVGYWGWVFQQTIFGTDKANLLDRCGSAVSKHNMKISLHSDNSVTPLGPLRFMEQAITRIMEGAPKTLPPQILNETECLTRFQALKSVTYDAAWQCHAEQWVGSLEAGKCADFVLLEQNPLTYTCEADGISAKGMRNIPVLETWKGGIKRYSTEDEIEQLVRQNPSLKVALKKTQSA